VGLCFNSAIHQYNQTSAGYKKQGTLLEEHTILIGANGWLHDEWSEQFYPDDLPDEWRLGYYGNEFSVVLVPASYWEQGADTVTEWLEETDESPRFVCEWPAETKTGTDVEKLLTLFSMLSDRVLGILIPVNDTPDQSMLSLLERLSQDYPVCIDVQTENPQDITATIKGYLKNTDVSICWHGEPEQVEDMASGSLVVARISDHDLTPRALRFLVEECIKQSKPDRSVALIFDGDPPALKQMVDAGVILDLL